jgi:hypothetical protein
VSTAVFITTGPGGIVVDVVGAAVVEVSVGIELVDVLEEVVVVGPAVNTDTVAETNTAVRLSAVSTAVLTTSTAADVVVGAVVVVVLSVVGRRSSWSYQSS